MWSGLEQCSVKGFITIPIRSNGRTGLEQFLKILNHIEPLSKNETLFTYSLLSGSYEEKENGQTADFSNLSALASRNSELLNLWRDFLQVVKFIDENQEWLKPLFKEVRM